MEVVMLQRKKSFVVVRVLGVIIIVLTSFVSLSAQGSKNVLVTINQTAMDNLKSAIKSDNPGLRKSGIYLSGKYLVSEVSETLLDQLKVEDDPSLKILIIRVLYMIENDKFMDDIYQVALNDEDSKVRRMAAAIYSVMQLENSVNLADSGN
jgi:hypothetical protein